MTDLNQTALEEARHLLAELKVFHANDAGDRAIRILRSLVETPSTPSPEAITSEELIQRTGGSCGPVDTRGFPPELREPSPLSALEPSPASVPVGARVMVEALRAVRDWIRKVGDDDEGDNYMNGDSDVYPGNGYDDLARIGVLVEAALAQPASGEGWVRHVFDARSGDGETCAKCGKNWRDTTMHMTVAEITSPREAEGEARTAPEQGGENVE